jgi:hypothetical protein
MGRSALLVAAVASCVASIAVAQFQVVPVPAVPIPVVVPDDLHVRAEDMPAPPATAPASRPTTRSAEFDAKVLALVKQLSDADIAKRDVAEQELSKLGTDALDALRAAREGKLAGVGALSADARARVENAIAEILDDDEAGPSRITLDFKDAPLEKILTEINRQARSSLPMPQQGFAEQIKKKITLKTDNASFFQALDALEKAANVRFQDQGNGVLMAFPANMGFGNDEGQIFDVGAFRFFATNASLNINVSYQRGGGGSSSSFAFQFAGRAEPKIRMQRETQMTMRIIEAKDSAGNDLAAGGENSNIWNQNSNQFNGSIQLRYPKNPGEKIAVIRGKLTVKVVKSVETIEVDDALSRRQTRTVEGLAITIDKAPDQQPAAQFVALRISAPWNGDYRVMQTIQQIGTRVKVLDADGNELANQGIYNQDNENNVMRTSIRFSSPNGNPVKGPIKLQIEVPKDSKDMDVPFEFRDLVMPTMNLK